MSEIKSRISRLEKTNPVLQGEIQGLSIKVFIEPNGSWGCEIDEDKCDKQALAEFRRQVKLVYGDQDTTS